MKKTFLITAAIAVSLSGCAVFQKKIPPAPESLPPVKVQKVQEKVDAGVESLLRQKESFSSMEEQFLFLQKLSQEIERLTDQTDEEVLDTPIPAPTPLP